MQAVDKQLEGPELEHERLEAAQSSRKHEDEMPTFAGEQVVAAEHVSPTRLLDAVRTILAREQVQIRSLGFPRSEQRALEFLRAAVTGHDTNLDTFLYAEDRRVMLEQALAVLQQNITHGSTEELAKLHAKYGEMSAQLATLRHELSSLEDAQDELIVQDVEAEMVESDADDKPEDVDPNDPVAGFLASALQALRSLANAAAATPTDEAARASSLLGPDRPAAPAPPSTLSGPERAAAKPPASSLAVGPEPIIAKPKTTLTGPERPTPPEPPSTLTGPERAVDAPLASLAADRAMDLESPAAPPPATGRGPKRG